jgi:CRISPR system Cascade subunit CasD
MTSLVLRFAASLQSWGSSGFATRTTEAVPTRSGVLGLLASSLGIERGQDFGDLHNLDIWVRVEKAGRQEEDFHTINPPDAQVADARTRLQFLATGRKNRVDYLVTTTAGARWSMPGDKDPDTGIIGPSRVTPMVTRRRYLADAEFLVAIAHTDENVTRAVAAAARNPVFMTYLGRKACSPSFPFYLGLHPGTPTEVLAALPTLAGRGTAQALHHIESSRNPVADRVLAPVAQGVDDLWESWIRA